MKIVHNSHNQNNSKPESVDKIDNILQLANSFCNKYLNKEYLRIIMGTIEEYFEIDPKAFNLGKAEIWASSFIWAIGSVNFLGDKSFKPYASLNDICKIFGTKNSTVGNKAGKIRQKLDINHFNDEYLLENSPIHNLINSIQITEDGFISFDDLEQDKKEDDDGIVTDDGQINPFIIEGESVKKIDNSTYLQYEYMLKKMTKEWEKSDGREREIKIGLKNYKIITADVQCTLTEAGEIDEWMRNNGLKDVLAI